MAKVTIDEKAALLFVKRIEALEDRKDQFKADCRSECDEVTQDQVSVYDEAQTSGFDKKALKRYVKRRRLERDINDLDAGLEPEQQAQFVGLVEALGSLIALKPKKKAAEAGEARAH